MRSRPPIVLSRIAAFLGISYLLGAIGYRVTTRLGSSIELLAPLYFSLPGALAGTTLYAAWTGLRNRRQSAVGLVCSGAVGVILAATLEARWPAVLALLPPAASRSLDSLGIDFYRLLCDLSAIVLLFALFLAAYVPLSRRRPARDAGSAASPPPPRAGGAGAPPTP